MSERRHDPFDTDVEQALLGSLLKDNALIDQAAASLAPEDFKDPLHARMYQAIVTLSGSSRVTPLTLCAAMRGDAGLEEVGGLDYPETLALAAPYTTTVTEWVTILKDYAVRRLALDTAQEMIERVYEPTSAISSQKLIDEATGVLLTLGSNAGRPATKPAAVAVKVLERARAALAGQKAPSITTGYAKLDKAIGGLQAEDTVFIPGRSGMGKTTLWLNIALNAAWKGEAPVLLFSKEMPDFQLTQWLLCNIDNSLRDPQSEKPIHHWKFRVGCLSNYEITRLEKAREVLAGLRIEICDDKGLTMGAQMSRARAFARRYPGELGLIGLDFLQNLEDDERSRHDNREQVVSRLAYGQKRLAGMLGWPNLVTVQLKNKTPQGVKRDLLPTADDIRESGAVEMAGDIIFAPHRAAFFHKGVEPTVPHDRQEWLDWNEKMKEIEHDMWLRGFKNRHGDPAALNIELFADMGSAAIRDERPGRWRMPSESEPIEEMQF